MMKCDVIFRMKYMINLNNNSEDIISVDYKLRDMSHISYIMNLAYTPGLIEWPSRDDTSGWAWDAIGHTIYTETKTYL